MDREEDKSTTPYNPSSEPAETSSHAGLESQTGGISQAEGDMPAARGDDTRAQEEENIDEESSEATVSSEEESAPVGQAVAESEEPVRPLLAGQDATDLRARWEAIQTGFVDEPRRAVKEADALVADLMQRLEQTFAEERAGLETQWDRGDDVSTEDLRVALQRYRSFFQRLLST
jgi:hypothetical protein